MVLLPLTRTLAYAALISATAAGFSLALVDAGFRVEASPYALLLLAAIAAAAERQPVRVGEHLEMTVAAIPTIFAAVVFGPLAAMAVCAIGLMVEFRRPLARWLIWTSHRVLTAGLVGLSVGVAGRGADFRAVVLAVVLGCCVSAVLDTALGAVVAWVRQLQDAAAVVRSAASLIFSAIPLYAPALVLIITAYEAGFTWAFVLFLVPAVAAHSLYRLYRKERTAREAMDEANTSLQQASTSFAAALISALEARDEYTAGHSACVAVYSAALARELGLSEDEQELARLAGLLHDIGKVGLPPGLLEKRGPLTADERRQMEQHSVVGERILANVDAYREIARFVRHHHERVDGHGYPDGLDGVAIPLISRIVAVTDAYSAMTADRPYREALSADVARVRLRAAAGTQFDGFVVEALEEVLSVSGTSLAPVWRPSTDDRPARKPALSIAV